MTDVTGLQEAIRRAFAHVARPPNGSLHASGEGEEPRLLEAEFHDKHDWRALDPAFLDQAPDGYSSALSFFSDEALRYFLPAYLIADLEDKLDRVDVASRLAAPFSGAARLEKVNPRRYGELTRFEAGRRRYAALSREEAAAVAAYLEHKAALSPDGALLREALASYWEPRSRE